MPAKSQAFARMKAALLTLVRDIPSGSIAEVGAVAIALSIPSRHVAYILSQLNEHERDIVPWHRVVPTGGKFPATAKRTVHQGNQIALLNLEGVSVRQNLVIANLQDRCIELSNTQCDTFWADKEL